jgi:hypothetical protein
VSGNVLTGCWAPDAWTLTLSFTVRVDPRHGGESVLGLHGRDTSPSAAPTDASAQVKVKGHVSCGWGSTKTRGSGDRLLAG